MFDADGAPVSVSIENGKIEAIEPDLVFKGQYSKEGQDLIISGPDGAEVTIVDYFTFAFPPDVIASNGSVLRGEDVVRLSGAGEDLRLVQAQGDAGQALPDEQSLENAIGQVESFTGVVRVTRADGSLVTLGDGDLLFQNDVLETAPGSTVSVTFVDGTVFSLSGGSRMVLDELIYDANGSDNSAVFSLIEGGFVFITGQIAPTGGMDVRTPTGVIGIRGTSVECQILSNEGVTEVLISLLLDPDGSIGRVELSDLNGDLVAVLTDTDTSWVLSPLPGETREIPRSEADQLSDPQLRVQATVDFQTAAARVSAGGTFVSQDRISGGGDPDDGQGQDGVVAPGDGVPDDGGGTPIAPDGQDGGDTQLDDGVPDDASVEPVPPAPETPDDEANIQDGTPTPVDPAVPDTQQETPDVQNVAPQNGDAAVPDAPGAVPDTGEQIQSPDGTVVPQQDPAPSTPPTDDAGTFDEGNLQTPPEGGQSGTLAAVGSAPAEPSDFAGLDLVAPDETQAEAVEAGKLEPETVETFNLEGVNLDESGVVALDIADPTKLDDPNAPIGLAAIELDQSGVITPVQQETGGVGATASPPTEFASSTLNAPQPANYVFQPASDVSFDGFDLDGAPTDGLGSPANSGFEQSTPTGSDTDLGGSSLVAAPPPNDFPDQPVSPAGASTPSSGNNSAPNVENSEPEVTVDNAPVNDAPVGVADAGAGFATSEDTGFTTGSVLTNDTDVEGGALSVASFEAVSAQGGTVASNGDGTFAYTPAAGFNGTDSFGYTVADAAGAVSGRTEVTISVGAVNDAPVGVADGPYEVSEDGVLNVSAVDGVLFNDSDPELSALSAELVSDVSNGVLVLNADGSFAYTPGADFAGTDGFSYVARDAEGAVSAVTAVSLTVTPVNDAPVGVADAGAGFATSEDTGFTTGSVLTNDTDVEGGALSVASFEAVSAQGGTVASNGDGTFAYTPAAGFNGTDSFGYTVADAAGAVSGRTEVTISVGAVNDAPVGVADGPYEVSEDGVLNVSAVDGVLFNDSDPELSALSAELVSDVSNGVLVLNADGSFAYTPGADFAGTDGFSYVARDAEGAVSAVTAVSLTVTPVNDAPVGVADAGAGFATSEDTGFTTGSVLTNDTDVEGGALSVASFEAVSAQGGTVASNGDGTFAYTPAAGFNGTDSFGYTVADAAGAVSGRTEVTISVGAVNDAPVGVADGPYEVSEDGVLNVSAVDGVLFNDSDPELSALSAELVSDVSNGVLVLNADGSFAYTPGADFAGTDGFSYVARDAEGAVSAVTAVSLTVTPVNDAPVGVADAGAGFATSEDTGFTTGSVLTNDTDVEGGALSVASFEAVSAQGGTVASNGDGTFAYTPAAGFNGTDSFGYTVADAAGAVSGRTEVTISVGAVNDAPVGVADGPYEVSEDGVLNVSAVDGVLFNDSDPELSALSAELVSDVSNGVLVLNADGSFAYTPGADFAGTDGFSYVARDAEGAVSAVTAVSLTVTPVNDAPVGVADAGAGFATSEDTGFTTGSVLTNDTDVEGGALSVASFEAVSAQGGTVASNGDGTFAYTPAAGFNGTDSFGYTVADAAGAVSGRTEVTISVGAVNDAPVGVADGPYEVSEDGVLNVSAVDGVLFNDSDPELSALSAELVSDVSNGVLVLNADGSFAYTPGADFAGTDGFSYVARDAEGAVSAVTAVSLTVTPVNDAPVGVADAGAGFATAEDTGFTTGSVLTNDTDVEGGALSVASFEAVSAQGGTVASNGDGTFAYTPAAGFNGTDSFGYTVADAAGAVSGRTEVTISVGAVNDAPVGVADGPYEVSEDGVLNVSAVDGVLFNDSDPELSALSAELVSDVSNGVLVLNADGSFAYTPGADFAGTDGFSYVARDAEGAASAVTAVSLTVTPVNDAPVVRDDSFTTTENTIVLGDIFTDNGEGADFDPEGSALSLVSASSGGGSIAVNGTTVLLATGATLQFNSDGTFSFNPGGLPAPITDFEALGDGESLTETFTYTVQDAEGLESTGTVSIVVDGENDAPIPGLDQYNLSEDASITGNALTDITTGAGADFDPEGDFFEITALNGQALADVDEDGGQAGIQLTVNGRGQLTIFADGAFTFDTAGAYDDLGVAPTQPPQRLEIVEYTITDSNGASASGDLRFFVSGANDAPVAADDTASTAENTAVDINVLANDTDPENDDLTVSAFSQGTNGTVTAGPAGQLTYTPNTNFSGSDTFTYDVTDGSLTQTATVTVTVSNVNNPPVADPDAVTVAEDSSNNVIAVLTNDSDPDGDPLTVTAVGAAANGTARLELDGSVTYTPDADFNGSDSFTYDISDGLGGTAQGAVNVTVTPVNDLVTLNTVAGDNVINLEEQVDPVVISGLAEVNGSVEVVFGSVTQQVSTDGSGVYQATFDAADIPDATTVDVSVTATDSFGNAGGTVTRTIGIEQTSGTLNIALAGSTTNVSNSANPGLFDISDLPYEALFVETSPGSGVFTERAPSTQTATEIRYTAASGRSFAYIGEGLDLTTGAGVVTGFQFGTASDPDAYDATGIRVAFSELLELNNQTLLPDGSIDITPIDGFFAAFDKTINGSAGDDTIALDPTDASNNIFIGGGGIDEFRGGTGDDSYTGGEGSDFFEDAGGVNFFEGAGGNDFVSYQPTQSRVVVDLNAGTAEKIDSAELQVDTLRNIESIRGSLFDDTIQGLDSADFSSIQGLDGADFLSGGSGGLDFVDYSRDHRFTNRTTGVVVSLVAGAVATDLFGSQDTLSGFEGVFGSIFGDDLTAADTGSQLIGLDGDDTLRSGTGNDTLEGGEGLDTLVYSGGNDVVFNFIEGEDSLQFTQNILDVIGTGEVSGTDTSATFSFDGGAATLLVVGLSVTEAAQILIDAGGAGTTVDVLPEDTEVSGTAGSDQFTVLAGGENINRIFEGSAGDDTYIFTDSSFTVFNEIDYSALGLEGITAGINLGSAADLGVTTVNSFVDKGAAGIDTLIDVWGTSDWGFGLRGTSVDDVINVTQNQSDFSFLLVDGINGADQINYTGNGASGIIRLNIGDGSGAFADLALNDIRGENGNTVAFNFTGDNSGTQIELRGNDGFNEFLGTDGRNRFILGPDDGIADGRGGDRDLIRYDRNGVGNDVSGEGVFVDLQPSLVTVTENGGGTRDVLAGEATGIWDGRAFTHALLNIEEVRGSALNDTLRDGSGDERLFGRDGDDRLFSGDGRDTLFGGNGDDLLDASAGLVETQVFGDAILPGLGNDTIIGNEAAYQNERGIDVGYDDLQGVGGVRIDVAIDGSGTTTGLGGAIDPAFAFTDTFTFADFWFGSRDNDIINGSDADRFQGYAGAGGANEINGAGGFDQIFYDGEIELLGGGVGIDANLSTGIIVNTQGLEDTVTGIEAVGGTELADRFVDNDADNRFEGYGGDDVFITGEGRDRVFAGAGDDFIDASAGTPETQDLFAGDFINPGLGRDTVLGNEALWLAGEGIDIGYSNIDLAGGLVFNIDDDNDPSTAGTVRSAGLEIDDTFTYANFFEGSNGDDVFNGSDLDRFEGFVGAGGADIFNGGAGFDDTVVYEFEQEFFGGSGAGILANFAAGTVRDTQGFVDQINGIERIRGSVFSDTISAAGFDEDVRIQGREGDDLIIDGNGNDSFDLDAGNDTLRFTAGNDYVDDFNVAEDTLEFAGDVLANFGTLGLFEFSDRTGTFLEFRVPDQDDTGIALGSGISMADAYAILAPTFATFSGVTKTDGLTDFDIFGTAGADRITIDGPVDADRSIRSSAGNDIYDFGASTEIYANFDYERIGSIGIDAVIDLLSGGTSTVVKGNTANGGDLTALAGEDQIIDLGTISDRLGAQISSTRGDDTIEVSFNTTGNRDFFSIQNNGGTDFVTVTEVGRANLQLQLGRDGDVFADLAANDIRAPDRFGDDNTRFFVDFGGADLAAADLRYDIRTRAGNDEVYGTDTANRFTLEAGDNFVDGRGGLDTIRYNSSGYTSGLVVDLRPLDPNDASMTTQVTGTYRGEAFTDTLVNIENVDGSQLDDEIYGSSVAGRLEGRNGNDTLRGFEGNDSLYGGNGDDILVVESFQDVAFVEGGIVDGGDGRDIALFDSSSGGQFDLTAVDLNDSENGLNMFNIEVLSLEDGTSDDRLILSVQDIFDLGGTSDPLLDAAFGGVTSGPKISIYGDAGDFVDFVDRANFGDPVDTVDDGEGRTLNVFNYSEGAGVLAIVAVEDEVTVNTA